MTYPKPLLLLVLLSLLSACAPTVPGSSSSNPKDLDKRRVVTVTPGRTWFLAKSFDFRDFDLKQGDFATSISQNSRIGSRYISNANSKFSLAEVELPAGWDLKLWNARAVKDVVEVGGRHYYTIDTNFALRVPGDAEPGSYRVSATLQADNGTTQTLTFTVTVVPERSS